MKSLNLHVDNIVDAYNKGISTHEIAKTHNCSQTAVYYQLKKAGVAFRSCGRPAAKSSTITAIITLYQDGVSTRQIEKKLKTSTFTIYKTLRENNIPLKKNTYYARRSKDPQAMEAIRLYKETKTLVKEIKAATGINPPMLYRLLKHHKIPLRYSKGVK